MVSRQPCSPFLPQDWIEREGQRDIHRHQRHLQGFPSYSLSASLRYDIPFSASPTITKEAFANFPNSNCLQCSLILTLLSVACLRMQGCRSDRCLPADESACLSLLAESRKCVEFKDWHLTFILDSLSDRARPWLKKGKWPLQDMSFFRTVIDL